jgi:hypothetical protein
VNWPGSTIWVRAAIPTGILLPTSGASSIIRFDNRDSGLSGKFEGGPEVAAPVCWGVDPSTALYLIEDTARRTGSSTK